MKKDKRGLFPIRVLPGNFMDWFLNITPDFKEEFEGEIAYNNLNELIAYKVTESSVTIAAEITSDHQIVVYENYNELLWCVCYGLLTIYDESYVKPSIAGSYKGDLIETSLVSRAMSVFGAGISLAASFHKDVFFELPNPETIESDSEYVTKANGIYCGAMTFTLLHEFAHQIYGHVDYYSTPGESKKDELSADDYAIYKIRQNFGNEKGATLKAGVVMGIIALSFLDKSLCGGETHPDLDDRLQIAMEMLDLDENNHLWGIASLGLTFWTKRNGYKVNMPMMVETTKDLFYLTCDEVRRIK